MIQNHKRLITYLLAISLSTSLAAIDNAHFYKAANLHRSSTTSWFDELKNYENSNWLTKIDATYAYGDTRSCWDKNGKTASLLNSTGNQNMLYIAQNVAKVPSIDQYTNFLAAAAISQAATNGTFGQLVFNGKFRINDINLNIRQNIAAGFFLELLTPIRNVSFKNISYTDLSPDDGIYSKTNSTWIQFKNSINTFLNDYGYKAYNKGYDKTGFGDMTLLLGWEGLFQTGGKDPIKFAFTGKTGVLFPTGTKEKTDYLFSVPTGYNGHWAIPIFVQLDVMPLKWLTFTGDASAAFFFDETMNKRMKTFSKQQGYIKLAQGRAKEGKGVLWHLGLDAKLDHFFQGVSVLFGYSYNKQEKDSLKPNNTTLFDGGLVESDSLTRGFTTHVFHLMADYDYSIHMEDSTWAPRISIFYNYPFAGKNMFKTDLIGAGLGFDIRWKI